MHAVAYAQASAVHAVHRFANIGILWPGLPLGRRGHPEIGADARLCVRDVSRISRPHGRMHAFTDNQFPVRPANAIQGPPFDCRSEEHTSELQSLMRISYAVFCLKKKKPTHTDSSKHTLYTATKH